MLDKIARSAALALTLALGWAVVGCGATGLAWVDQSEPASGWSESEARAVSNAQRTRHGAIEASIPATLDSPAVPESHPRLNHTITLGEVDATPPGEQLAAASGPSVSVTINNYGQAGPAAPAYSGYSGFGARASQFGSRGSSAVTSASRSGAAMQPGQNWPAVADHGTSFPYRSAPASPWR